MRLFPEWICLFQNTSVCLVVLHAASRGISACLHCSLRKIGKSFGGSSRRPGRDTECDWWKKTWMEDSMLLWWRLASGISDPAGNYKKVMVIFHRLINVVIAGTHKRSGWGLGYDPFALLTPAEAFSSLKDDVSGKAWRFPRFITMWQDSSPFLSFWVVVEFRRFHELNDSLCSDQLHRWQWPSDPFPSWNLRLQTGCTRRWIPKTLGWFRDSTSTNGEYHHRIPVLNQYWNSIHIYIYIECRTIT